MLTTLAFDRAYRAHADAVLRWARGIMRDDFAGEDAAQDAWLSAWKSRDSFDGSMPFVTWIRAIVRRACWRMMNPKRNEIDTVSIDAMPVDERAAIEPVTDAPQDAHIDAVRVSEAVEGIPAPVQREVASMAIQGLDTGDIGRARGTTQQGASDALQKAIRFLRNKWGIGT